MSDHKLNFEERLKRHPVLKSRICSLLDIIENFPEDAEKADGAELRVINELRRMGNEILHEWASEKESAVAEEFRRDNENLIGHGKKNSAGTRRSAQ